ncbi:hypothetical protein QTP88_025741 [Uroleucon formosanum]
MPLNVHITINQINKILFNITFNFQIKNVIILQDKVSEVKAVKALKVSGPVGVQQMFLFLYVIRICGLFHYDSDFIIFSIGQLMYSSLLKNNYLSIYITKKY